MRPRPLRSRAASATTRTRGAGSRSARSRRRQRARAPGWPAAPPARPAPPRAPRACRRGSGRRPRAGPRAGRARRSRSSSSLSLSCRFSSRSTQSAPRAVSVRFLCDSEMDSKFAASASRAASSLSRSSSRAVHSSRSRPRFASRSAWAIEAWSRFSSASLGGQVELAAVELAPRGRLLRWATLPLSASSRSKRSASSAQLLLLEQELGLALADRLVAGGDRARPPSSGRSRAAEACARAPRAPCRARATRSRASRAPARGRRAWPCRPARCVATSLSFCVSFRSRSSSAACACWQLPGRLLALPVARPAAPAAASRRPPAARPRGTARLRARPGGRRRVRARPRSPRAGRGPAARAPRARPRTRPASPRARRGSVARWASSFSEPTFWS